MDRYLITATILSILSTSVLSEPDLQQLNSHQDDLNPLNEDNNFTSKAQEKRTIFNPTIKNYAWAKHVSIRPSGTKYLLGYSPVDLKYRPVLRPISISHQGYHYNRPKIHFQLKKPIVHIPQVKPVLQTGWKPVLRPAVPIHVPPPSHLLTKPARPVLHVDHVDEVKPAHVDHLHLDPVPHLDHIQAQKVPAVHVDHIHQLPIPHIDYIHKLPNVQHLHQVPVAHVDHVHQQVPLQVQPPLVPIPAAPVPQPPQIIHQAHFVPSAQLFEVTKPDLGVLPLGAVFQSPVLKDIPAAQFKPTLVHQHFVPATPVQHVHPVVPAAPVHHVHQLVPAAPVQHVHPVVPAAQLQPVHPVTHLHPVPSAQPVTHLHPVAHQPVAPVQQLVPASQAFNQVEYHGNTNFINLLRGQAPVNAVHNLLPNHYHLQYPQIPQEQVVPHLQIPRPSVFQQQLPHEEPVQVVHSGTTGLFPNQQQVPLDTQPHFQLPQNHPGQVALSGSGIFPNQQQLPLDSQSHFQDAGQNVFQQQLPQTQTHFQQHHSQTENDVQHVYPQDNYQYQVSQNNLEQQFHQGNFQQPLHQGNFQEVNNFQQEGNSQQEGNVGQEDNSNAGQFQPADQVSSVHFYRPGQFQIGDQDDGQRYFYPQPDNVQDNGEQGHSIRPGETDLQFPLHLPHHPGFAGTGRQFKQDESEEDSQRNDSEFRPSIQLEPPYKKK